MATLYKRATPSQAMILRVVEGSIKNACDAHQEKFDPYFARSAAKRTAGTLTAIWPEVLAAKPSEKLGVATKLVMSHRAARQAELTEHAAAQRLPRARAVTPAMTAPLRSLEKWMVSQMREIKISGNMERAEAFIDVLRKISKLKQQN